MCVEESVLQYIKIRTFPHNTLFKNLFAKVILFISAADIRYRVGAMSTLKKKLLIFPSPAGMSLAKLSLAGKNEIIPGQGEFGK